MARKVRCPACGAMNKNKGDVDRCRVCSAPLADQSPKGDQLDLSEMAHESEESPENLPPIYNEVFEPITLPPGRSSEPPAPTRDNPVVQYNDHFDLDAIDIDLNKYGTGGGTPVIDANAHFDSSDLKVEKVRLPPPPERNPDAPPVFDLDALIVEDPCNPKPS